MLTSKKSLQNKVPGWDCYEHTDKTIKKKKRREKQ